MAHDLKRTGRRRTILPPPSHFAVWSQFFSSSWSLFRAPSRGGRFSSVKSNLFFRRCSRYIPRISSSPLSPPPILPFVPRGPWSPFELHGRRNRAIGEEERQNCFEIGIDWCFPSMSRAHCGDFRGVEYAVVVHRSLVLSTRSLADIFVSFLSPEQHLSSKKMLPV